MTLTPAQQDLVERTHRFAEEVIRPVAAHYDREEEFPWPVLEAAAEEGFYNPLFYRDLIGDPTGLSLPLFMEELFWGCAGLAATGERRQHNRRVPVAQERHHVGQPGPPVPGNGDRPDHPHGGLGHQAGELRPHPGRHALPVGHR